MPSCVVLLAEDEWLVRMDITDALTEASIDVIEASSGEEAIELLDADRHVDVLITDIRLDGPMSGWDLAEEFSRRRPNAGVIYSSANEPVANRRVDGSMFFAKPASMRVLIAACRMLCDERA